MNDTRLIAIMTSVEDAQAGLDDMLDEPCSPHDFVDLGQAESLLSTVRKLLQQARKELAAAATPMVCNLHGCPQPLGHEGAHQEPEDCNSGYGFSSYCRLEKGHGGKHTNGRIEWDDIDASESRKAILKSMGGRTE